MNLQPFHQAPALLDNILVSVCFSDLSADEETFNGIRALADALGTRFRFREIILVVDSSVHEEFLPLVQTVDNVRLFSVRPGTSRYQKRVISADEAIGDIVLVANIQELAALDSVAMIERASDGVIVLGLRANSGFFERVLAAPLVALGRTAGFKVGINELQTIAFPRTLLNQVLAHSDAELALRFLPRDSRLPLDFVTAGGENKLRRSRGETRRRLVLMQKLLVRMAPTILFMVTMVAGLLSLLGFGYACYVFAVWLLATDIEPGWVTISMMLSLSVSSLGVAIFGLSLGLQYLIGHFGQDSLDSVAHEINRIDLFGQVSNDLNIDFDQGEEAARPEKA